MRVTIAALVVGVSLGACVDVDFLDGVRCSNDQQCGRALECSQGFCGGCPEDGKLADGSCGCGGDRIFDCRAFTAAPWCMPMCATQRDQCAVTIVLEDGERRTLVACADAEGDEACFTIAAGTDLCAAGEDQVQVSADLGIVTLVANCPPKEDERFDCEPGT